MNCALTVLRTTSSLPAVKTWSMGAGGRPVVASYGRARRFRGEEVVLDGFADLSALLTVMEGLPYHFVVRGAIVAGVDRERMRRLLHENKDGGQPTLLDVARRWLCIDVDGAEEVEDRSFVAAPAWYAAKLRSRLPVGFRRAACHWQASASAGMAPGVRLHLWFWLDRAVLGRTLKTWLRSERALFDPAMLGAAQAHYTAAPLFDGIPDPVRLRSGVLPGGDVLVPANVVDTPQAPTAWPGVSLADVGFEGTEAAQRQLQWGVNLIAGATALGRSRTQSMYTAAVRMGAFVKAGGIGEALVIDALTNAMLTVGSSGDDLERQIRNGLREGTALFIPEPATGEAA